MVFLALFASQEECTHAGFHDYLASVGRSYASPTEFDRRFKNYCFSLEKLAVTRVSEPFSEHQLDEYADLSHEEFAKIRLNGGLTVTPNDYGDLSGCCFGLFLDFSFWKSAELSPTAVDNCLKNNASSPRELEVNDLPDAFDWREKVGSLFPFFFVGLLVYLISSRHTTS